MMKKNIIQTYSNYEDIDSDTDYYIYKNKRTMMIETVNLILFIILLFFKNSGFIETDHINVPVIHPLSF